MSLIQITNLTFSYEGAYDAVFDKVSFQIDTDWKLGFVGRNGRGKTTFLKLLTGEYEYGGTITASVAFTYFPYPVKDTARTPWEILEEQAPGEELWRIYRELNMLGVEEEALYRPFLTLSSGEQTKILLAALFIRENQFLLIDEPTNHLDSDAREKIGEYLSRKKGFILVSHDRKLLDQVTDHTLSINKTDIEVHRGSFSSWYANKEAKDRMELARNEKLKGDIRRLKQSARQAQDWSQQVEKTKYGQRIGGLRPDRGAIGHKAAKMMKRAKSLEHRKRDALEEKEGLLKNLERAEALKLYPEEYYRETLVSARELSLRFGEREIFRDLNFQINRGDRIRLRGKNGSGKSSMLKLILGWLQPSEGKLQIGAGLTISYVPQSTDGLRGRLRDYAKTLGVEEALFMAMLRKLDFKRDQFEKDMEDFSAGQKKKALLAGSLCQRVHLYVWDEPLNYVDVLSRIQIEDLILEYEPTLLFVEHDDTFSNKIANKVLEL